MTMASAGNNRSGFDTPVVVLGAVAAILFVYAISLFLRGGFTAMQAQESVAKIYDTSDEQVAEYRAEQQAILNERTRWLNEDQGTLCMPVEDAVDRFVAQQADAAE
ncbi:MAG: hypothetical protein GY838_14680 [bacterium]|nr:hypothetical protein [bacterium]